MSRNLADCLAKDFLNDLKRGVACDDDHGAQCHLRGEGLWKQDLRIINKASHIPHKHSQC